MNDIVIDVRGLNKTYKSYKKAAGFVGSVRSLFWREAVTTEAVKGLDFTVRKGELVGFLGPNGAGKTTALKMLSGILYPTSGEATVLGYRPWERDPAFQKRFAIVMGQKSQLWWDLPAMESFLLNKEIYEIPNKVYRESLEELTSLLDIKGMLDVPVRKLSLGERMKAELVASLLHRPEVLFLDEPTIGLDVSSQLAIRQFLLRYNRENETTILLTSHYMEDVEALCKRIIVINKGEKVYDGSLEEMVRETSDHKVLTVTFTEAIARDVLEPLGKVIEYNPQRVVLHVPRSESKQVAAKMLTEMPVDDVLIDEPDIEDVVRKVFKETGR